MWCHDANHNLYKLKKIEKHKPFQNNKHVGSSKFDQLNKNRSYSGFSKSSTNCINQKSHNLNWVHLSFNYILWIKFGRQGSIFRIQHRKQMAGSVIWTMFQWWIVVWHTRSEWFVFPGDYLDACFTCELATASTLSPEAVKKTFGKSVT